MDSRIKFKWNRPIAFSPQFVEKLTNLVEDFKRRLTGFIVTKNGHSAADIKSASDASKLYEQSNPRDYTLRQIETELSSVEQMTWLLTLADNSTIVGLDTPRLLALPNVGRHRVVSAEYENNSSYYRYRFAISFSDELFRGGTNVDMAGPFELIQQFRNELETLLSSFTQPWWLMREGHLYFWPAALVAITFINVASAINVWHQHSPPDAGVSSRVVFGIILPFVGVLLVVTVPLVSLFYKMWNWLFPRVDFLFGGGVTSSEIRRNVRRALWGVPILMFVIPLAVNLLSSKIKF